MQVLNLATEEKQEQILNNFPINGGVDWASKNIFTNAPITTHKGYTWANIQGSGYLIGIFNGGTSALDIAIQIDGGQIYHFSNTSSYNNVSLFPLRFNNSCVVSCGVAASANRNLWVVLD